MCKAWVDMNPHERYLDIEPSKMTQESLDWIAYGPAPSSECGAVIRRLLGHIKALEDRIDSASGRALDV
jgi:hypothetical protein